MSEAVKPGKLGTRRFKPYPAYNDSGVEWLGEIPSHWIVRHAKHDYEIRLGKMLQPEPRSSTDVETPYIRALNVQWEKVGTDDLPTMWASPHDIEAYSVHKGDLLVCEGGEVGRAGVLYAEPAETTIIQNAVHRVRYRPSDVRFLMFVLESAASGGWFDVLCNKATIQRFTREKFGALPIAIPPIDEQRAITRFLGREMAKIDALVAKNERLIELFQEKRTALITRAVTKGLDPNVPMKDSGIEWLGEIPTHWEAKQLRWAIMFQRGHDLPGDEREEGDVPLVSSSGVSSTHSRAAAKGPGIVTGRHGTIGQFYLIEDDFWPLNTTLYSIDLRQNDEHFLRYMLINLSPLFLLNAVKSAVPGVDRNDIHPTQTAVPPLAEQRAISAYLDQEMMKIESLVAKIHDAIDRLKELRTALISAAVTGKIDVRGAAGD